MAILLDLPPNTEASLNCRGMENCEENISGIAVLADLKLNQGCGGCQTSALSAEISRYLLTQ